jgi:cellulose synthase/poly-beta-1,6-N-acetylglucosamine synthase-like glycosyltransferase
MGDSLISIIIPTLNEEKYIESVLKSIRNQDYKGKYEIIVVDGMSKDNTVKMARKSADKVIQIKKKGIAEGRNAGTKVAKGDILFFIDADTILLFNGLNEIVKPFKKKDVVGVTCPILPLSPKAKDFALYWYFNLFMKRSIKSKKAQIPGLCCAYRRRVFEKVGGFDENLDTLEDFDLSEKISKLGKIILVDSTLALTSNRRVEKWGRIKSIKKYLKLYFNYVIKGKVMSVKEYKPIR